MKNPLIQWICVAALALVCCGASLPQLHAQTPPDTIVTIKGKKFAPGVEVYYYDSTGVRKRLDSSRVNRIDSKTIRSLIPGWLLNVPGKYPITVQNPSPSRGGSNSDTLTIVRGNAPVRTDTALWFRFTSNERAWHEKVSGTPLSQADSIFIIAAGSPIIEQKTVEAVFFRNGNFRLRLDKQNDPLMAKYVSPSVQTDIDRISHEQIEINGMSNPVIATTTFADNSTSRQELDIPTFRPFIDALASNVVQQYPNTLNQGDTTSSKILIATARADGHTVVPIVGQGRFKIIMNTIPTNLFGFSATPGRTYVIRVDTERNYIESIEIRGSANAIETGIYYKLRDDSQPNNPIYELVMTEQYYDLPDSDLRMKFIYTKQYQTLQIKNFVTQKPIIPATR